MGGIGNVAKAVGMGAAGALTGGTLPALIAAGSTIYSGMQQGKAQAANQRNSQNAYNQSQATGQSLMGRTNPYTDMFQSYINSQGPAGQYNFAPGQAAMADPSAGQAYNPSMIDQSLGGDYNPAMVGQDLGGYNASMMDPSYGQSYNASMLDPSLGNGYDPSQIDLSSLSMPDLGEIGGQDSLNQFLRRDPSGQTPDTQALMSALQANQGIQTTQQANQLGAQSASLGRRGGTAANIGQAMLRGNLTAANNASNAQLVAGLNESAAQRALSAATQQSNVGVQSANLRQQGQIANQGARLTGLTSNQQAVNSASQFGATNRLAVGQANQTAGNQAASQMASNRLAVGQVNSQMQNAALASSAAARLQSGQYNASAANSASQFGIGNRLSIGSANAGARNAALSQAQQAQLALAQSNQSARNNMTQFNSSQGLNAFTANQQAQQAQQAMMLQAMQAGSSAWGQQAGMQNQTYATMAGQAIPQIQPNTGFADSLTTASILPAVFQRLYGQGAQGAQGTPAATPAYVPQQTRIAGFNPQVQWGTW